MGERIQDLSMRLAGKVNQSSNVFLDNPGIVIQTPDPSAVRRGDKDDFLQRLNELETPKERLVVLLKSLVIPYEEPTHEAAMIRAITFSGATLGFFHGAMMKSRDVHMNYAREHNASLFENRYHGNRHFWDTLVKNLSSRAWPYALKAALLSAAASTTAFGSIACRNELYLPDWIVGFTAIGSISRSWLGMKGIVMGGAFGMVAGLLGFGLAKTYELVIGQSVSQMRYIEHTAWLERRAAFRAKILLKSQQEFYDRNRGLD